MNNVSFTNAWSFPTEVWLAIFELATFVPNAFDTHAPDPFAHPGPATPEEVQLDLREAMHTKFNLVLVCRTWHSMAICLLYRNIIIDDQTPVVNLLQFLDGDMPMSLDSEIRKGQCTLRLDVSISVYHFPDRGTFLKLLRCLPKLQIIVFDEKFYWAAPVLFDALAAKSTRSLHVLDMKYGEVSHSQQFEKLSKAINGQPLRVLCIRQEVYPDAGDVKMDVSHIEHLEIPGELLRTALSARNNPPLLSYLMLTTGHEILAESMNGRFSRLGWGLTTLELDKGILYYSRCATDLLRRIADLCPRLANLIVNLRYSFVPFPTSFLPPIERLGIRLIRNSGVDAKWCSQFCLTLSKLIGATPTIKIIRLTGKSSLDELMKHGAESFEVLQRSSSVLYSEHGVRFEDHTGILLHAD